MLSAGFLLLGLLLFLELSTYLHVVRPAVALAVSAAIVVTSGRASGLLLDASLGAGLPLGCALGVCLSATSLIVVGNTAAMATALRPDAVRDLVAVHGGRIARQTIIVLCEESVWRGTLLYLLGFNSLGILLTSAAFALIHLPRVTRGIQLLDLGITGLVLAAAFAATGNIVVVSVAHWLRNALILQATGRGGGASA